MSKTVFVTIARASLARNILQTGIVRRLTDAGHKIVLLTPAWQDEKFVKLFSHPQIAFEPLKTPARTGWDRFLIGFHVGLIYNATSEIVARYGTYHHSETNLFKWLSHKIVFTPLSHVRFLRDFFRWLDEKTRPDRDNGPLFDKYHPDLVFATNIMEDPDSFIVREAKRRGVPTIGMPKSWDNLSKMFMRSKPDQLIVWSEYMKGEAVKFQNFKRDDIRALGIPQFDIYFNREGLPTREAFLKQVGLEPGRKLVLFASEAKLSPPDPEFVDMLAKAIEDGRIPNAQLLVRPHFGFHRDPPRFDPFRGRPHVAVDTLYTANPVFYDQADYSIEHWQRLACSLIYADVVVTTFSTMTLDATACGTPAVNVMFDGRTPKPYRESIMRWYDTEHYLPVSATGAAVRADSESALIDAVNRCLQDRGIQMEGRERLKKEFIEPFDGKAGERIAAEVLRQLG